LGENCIINGKGRFSRNFVNHKLIFIKEQHRRIIHFVLCPHSTKL
jgi:hypothetical protein